MLSYHARAQVAARSRQLLIEYKSPSLQERRTVFSTAVAAAAAASTAGDEAACSSVMDAFVSGGGGGRGRTAVMLSGRKA